TGLLLVGDRHQLLRAGRARTGRPGVGSAPAAARSSRARRRPSDRRGRRVRGDRQRIGARCWSAGCWSVVCRSLNPLQTPSDLTINTRQPGRAIALKRRRPAREAPGGASIAAVRSGYALVTFAACGPLRPSVTSNSTRWPCSRLLKPSPEIAL